MIGEVISLILCAVVLGVIISAFVYVTNENDDGADAWAGLLIFFGILFATVVTGLGVDICREHEHPIVETEVKPQVDSTTTISSNPPDTTTIYIYDFKPREDRQ